jgi:hypothetical protein
MSLAGGNATYAHKNQEIPVHGGEHAAASGGVERQDARYPEDAGDGAVSENKKGMLGTYTSGFRAHKSLQPGSDPIEATFELNDTLYAKAHIPPTEEVYLWLGVGCLGIVVWLKLLLTRVLG